MNERKDFSKSKIVISVTVGLVAEFIYYFYGSKWSAERIIGNIQIYVIGTLIFFIAYMVALFIVARAGEHTLSPVLRTVCLLAVISFSVVYFFRVFKSETENYPQIPLGYFRHMIPGTVYAIVLVLCVMLVYSKAIKCDIRGGCARTRGIFTALIVFVQAWFLYCPNPFADELGTIYHIDAYTNSIINTLYFAPHELYSASIYGHYGLFYIIPCKLLRILGLNEWLAVAAAIAITGGICFALGYWTLHKMVRSDTVYYLSVLACTVVSTEIFWGQYFQMLPHRLLFQTVMMACFLKIYTEQDKHRRHVFMAIGWLASACAILWNIEIGAVCALVWTIGIAFLESQERGKWSLIVIIKNIAFLAGAFFLAYGIVNLYNIAVGGKGISVSTFIYPIGSKSYVIEKLYLPLMNSWGPYFAVIASFLVVLGYYFMDFLHLRLSIRQLMMLLAAIMGYGVYTYYINRPVEGTNASICIFPLVFVLTVLCDNYFGDSDGSLHGILRKPAQSGTSLFALTILVSMALASVSTFGKTLSEKISTTYDETLFKETKSELLEKIPEGTVAFGTATAQLFAYANMDTGLYFADWEDLVDLSKKMSENGIVNPDAEKFLVQSLIDGNYEYILVYSEPSQERYLLDKYEEIDSIEYNSMCWKLYRKTLEGTTS